MEDKNRLENMKQTDPVENNCQDRNGEQYLLETDIAVDWISFPRLLSFSSKLYNKMFLDI